MPDEEAARKKYRHGSKTKGKKLAIKAQVEKRYAHRTEGNSTMEHRMPDNEHSNPRFERSPVANNVEARIHKEQLVYGQILQALEEEHRTRVRGLLHSIPD